MVAIGNLEVDIAADVSKLVKGFEDGAEKASAFAESMTGMAEKAKQAFELLEATMIFEKVAEGIKETIDATSKAEAAFNQIKASIASTGGAAGVTANQMDELATKMSRITGIPKSAIESADAILLTFNRIGKDVIPQATQVLADMSAKMGGDMATNATRLGRALQDPEKGVTLLQRSGLKLTQSQKDLIKSFQEAGDMAKAQGVILDALGTKFGGAAAAARDTLGGAFKQVGTDLEALWESLGNNKGFELFRTGIELVAVEIENLTDWVTSGKSQTDDFFNSIPAIAGPTMQATGHFITTFIGLAVDAWHTVSDAAVLLWQTVVTVTQGAMDICDGILTVATGGMWQTWKNNLIGPVTKGFSDMVGNVSKSAKDQTAALDKEGQTTYQNTLGKVIQPLQNAWDKSLEEVRQRMAKQREDAAKWKPSADMGTGADGDGGKAAKAAAEAEERQAKAAQNVLDAENKKLIALQNELAGNKDLTTLEEGIATIMKGANAADAMDMATRLGQVNKLQATWSEIEKVKKEIDAKKQDDTEVKQLTEVLQKEKDANKEIQNRLNGQKELTSAEKEEEEVAKILKGDFTAHKDLQAEITAEIQKKLDLEKQEDQKKVTDEIEKQTEKIKEQVKEAQLKLQGQKDLLPALKDEETFREEIAKITDPAVAQQLIDQHNQETAALTQLNMQITQQKTNYDAVMNSTESLTQKEKDLVTEFQAGMISMDQYNTGLQKLGTEIQKVNTQDAKQFSDTLEKSFDSAIKGGQSLDKIFQQLGKDLLMLVAKQLLFKPLSQWLGGGMQGGLGGLLGGITKPFGNLLGGGSNGVPGGLMTSPPQTVNLPGHAAGGPTSGLSVVGEAGPELFMGEGTILSNEILGVLQMLGLGGTGGVPTTTNGGLQPGQSRAGAQWQGSGWQGAPGASNGNYNNYGTMQRMIGNQSMGSAGGISQLSLSAIQAAGKGVAPTNDQWLMIEQDQTQDQLNKANAQFALDPSDYNATAVSEAGNQQQFWQGQTNGSVASMRFDPQGEGTALSKDQMSSFNNIPPSVIAYLMGSANTANYGLASGGGDGSDNSTDTSGSSDPGAMGGGLLSFLNPGGTGSALFGPGGDPGIGPVGYGGSGNGGMGGGSLSGGDPGNTGTTSNNGVKDYGGWGAGQLVNDPDGAWNWAPNGNQPNGQLGGDISTPFLLPDNSQPYGGLGDMGGGSGWIDDPNGLGSDPNGGDSSGYFDNPNNGALTALPDLLQQMQDSGSFLGAGDASMDDLMGMFTGDGTDGNGMGGLGSLGQDGFLQQLMTMMAAASGSYQSPFGFASGGRPLPNHTAMVGEDGPEIWEPDQPGRIIPNNQIGGYRTAGGGGDDQYSGPTESYSNNGAPEVHIHNNTKNQIGPGAMTWQKDHRGRDQLHVMINDLVSTTVNTGRTRNALVKGYQMNPRGTPRS